MGGCNMKKWLALVLGITSVAVTATTIITKGRIKKIKGNKEPSKFTVNKTPAPYWLPFTSGGDDIGWVNG